MKFSKQFSSKTKLHVRYVNAGPLVSVLFEQNVTYADLVSQLGYVI